MNNKQSNGKINNDSSSSFFLGGGGWTGRPIIPRLVLLFSGDVSSRAPIPPFKAKNQSTVAQRHEKTVETRPWRIAYEFVSLLVSHTIPKKETH